MHVSLSFSEEKKMVKADEVSQAISILRNVSQKRF